MREETRADGTMKLDIRDVAAKYLAYRSRTTAELRKYLKQKDFEEEAIEVLIREFTDYGYLDDQKYCHQYFDYAFGKGKGKRVIFAELREKGIDGDTIQFAFEDREDEFDEKSLAYGEAAKVLRAAGVDVEAEDFVSGEIREKLTERVDEKLIAKVGRRLQSKGYGSDMIYSVIGELRR